MRLWWGEALVRGRKEPGLSALLVGALKPSASVVGDDGSSRHVEGRQRDGTLTLNCVGMNGCCKA
jgi:hypothetical protein